MQIQIIGHQLEVTPPLREYVQEKFGRLPHHYDRIVRVHVTLSVQKMDHRAEATLHIPQHDVHAHADAGDMYSAIDLLLDKIIKQLVKYKEKHSQ